MDQQISRKLNSIMTIKNKISYLLMPLGALARLHAEEAFSKVYIYLFIQLDTTY